MPIHRLDRLGRHRFIGDGCLYCRATINVSQLYGGNSRRLPAGNCIVGRLGQCQRVHDIEYHRLPVFLLEFLVNGGQLHRTAAIRQFSLYGGNGGRMPNPQ